MRVVTVVGDGGATPGWGSTRIWVWVWVRSRITNLWVALAIFAGIRWPVNIAVDPGRAWW